MKTRTLLAVAVLIASLAVMGWLTRVYVLHITGRDGGAYGWMF